MDNDEFCPDCQFANNEHSSDCQVGWALSLRDIPDNRAIKPNPFIKLIKEATSETPEITRRST